MFKIILDKENKYEMGNWTRIKYSFMVDKESYETYAEPLVTLQNFLRDCNLYLHGKNKKFKFENNDGIYGLEIEEKKEHEFNVRLYNSNDVHFSRTFNIKKLDLFEAIITFCKETLNNFLRENTENNENLTFLKKIVANLNAIKKQVEEKYEK